VEQRSVTSLRKDLEKQGIDPARERVDLAARLPIRRQSESEWAARQALVEYQLRTPLDFQGSGDVLIRTGEGAAAADVGQLIVAALKSQIDNVLSDLLNEKGTVPRATSQDEATSFKPAIAAAEKADARGFRVTRVVPDAASGQVRVETQFVARLAAGNWKTVWGHSEQADATKVDPDKLEQIAADPRVKQALKLAESAGLGGESAIQQALRIGAATQQAQKQADSRFLEFRDRYLQHLDSPLLPLPSP
jgi:hypothetical protein